MRIDPKKRADKFAALEIGESFTVPHKDGGTHRTIMSDMHMYSDLRFKSEKVDEGYRFTRLADMDEDTKFSARYWLKKRA